MKTPKIHHIYGSPSQRLLFKCHEHLRQHLTDQFADAMKGHLASLTSFTMQWQRDGRLDYIVCDQLMEFINENS